MRIVDLVHRWTGGFIGVVLAVLGLSGALLVHKDAYLRATLPHAADAYRGDVALNAEVMARLLDAGADRPTSIVLATDGMGVHRLAYGENGGAYADQSGSIITRWTSTGERPEIWLFDLHHHLLAGETGETIAGIIGLIGLGFVITGAILWWRTRRTFRFRLWPKRMSRPAILRHHRDLGIIVAPLLFLSMLTGSIMLFRPVAALLLSPFSSSAELRAAATPPKTKGGALMIEGAEWAALLANAKTRYPAAQLRVIGLPSKEGDLITLRLRQPDEWLPNGRTTFWFDPADGRLVEARDALKLPLGARVFNLTYPLHAAKVGGLGYKVVMTVSGLALALLGSFTIFTFWSRNGRAVVGWRRKHQSALDFSATRV